MILLPSAPLRLLARLRVRGALRRQLRRARTPAGAAFLLIGAGAVALWVLSLLAGASFGPEPLDPVAFRRSARAGGALLVLLSLAGSLSHRGLYLPAEELEPLLSAPISRADLVRYRLLVSSLRSLLATVFLGVVVAMRAPRPAFAVLGVALAIPALAAAGQLAAILAGALEARTARRLARLPWVLLGLLALAGAGLLWSGTSAELESGRPITAFFGRVSGLLEHPAVGAATLPLEPWLRAISAASLGEFAPWAALCALAFVLLVELVAHVPIDFRELSLATSASIAQRIRRHRRSGGGASASSVHAATAGWRVPWVFGRGPSGALAWRKLVSMVRRARGTLTVGVLVVVLLTAVSAGMGGSDDPTGQVTGYAFLVVVGAIYLGGGLRYDFREDLDRMETVKTWPVAPARLFIATLLPEVALISALLAAAVTVRAALVGAAPEIAAALVVGLPLLVLAWVSLDNLLFLLLPVRFAPGQEGALQNIGRSMVTSILRFALLALVAAGAVALGAGAWAVAAFVFGAGPGVEAGAGIAGGLLALALCDVALVLLGGRALRRFDVARDRG